MSTDLTVLSARDIRKNVNLIQEVMSSVMKDGVHYGIIPGCPKPSLFKPGAEKIASTFRIAIKSAVEDLSGHDEKRYRVTCSAFGIDGNDLGSAVGECSTNEEKFKWRKPVCDQEFDETMSDRKREKWIKGKEGAMKIKQVRTEPSDLANTVLQMADKRAYVAIVRKVTAASDVFTQDVEDLPEGVLTNEHANAKPAVKQPEPSHDKTYTDIISLATGKIGDKLNIKAYFISAKHSQVGSKKSDITEYKIGDLPNNPSATMVIKAWGLPIQAQAGDVICFNAVEIGEYNNTRQYVAKDAVNG